MMEVGSTIAKGIIEQLLNVIVLCAMHRASGDKQYKESAARWIPNIEQQLANLKRELNND